MRILFGTAGLGFLLLAVFRSQEAAKTIQSLGPATVIAVFALAVLVAMVNSRAWANLFGEKKSELRRRYYEAQPAKYLPGGFAHPIGQVALARDLGFSLARVSGGFAIHVLCAIIASATLAGAGVLMRGSTPVGVRFTIGLGMLSVVSLFRPVLLRILNMWPLRRLSIRNEEIPDQAAILGCLLLTLAAFGLAGTAIWLLLDFRVHVIEAAGAFAFGWLAGYVAIPVPAGLGIREGAMAFLLSAALDVPTVVAAALAYRVLAMLGELALFLGSRRLSAL